MIDMKVTEEEKKMNAQTSVLSDAENYPYGLCLYLDADNFKKLGIPLPQIGDKLYLQANVMVKSLNASNSKGDVNEVDVSLQITEMNLGKDSKEKEPPESVIYKG